MTASDLTNWAAGPAAAVAGLAANALLQSSAVLAVGLLAARLARRRGAAVQSAVLRATLAVVLACPVASWALRAAGVGGLRVDLWPARAADAAAPPTPSPARPVDARARGPQTVADDRGDGVDRGLDAGQGDRTTSGPFPGFGKRGRFGPAGTADASFEADAVVPRVPGRLASAEGPAASASAAQAPARASSDIGGAPPPRPTTAGVDRATPAGLAYVAVAAAWAAGSALLLGRLAVAYAVLAGVRRRARPAPADRTDACAAAARAVGVRPPAVRVTARVGSPCLVGWRRPAVLLPDDGSPADPAADADVFLHELAHLRRGDCAWHLAARVACAALWFQPLAWVLARRAERAADDVCDDHVVALGGDRPAYARTLVDIAERLQTAHGGAPLWPARAAGVGVMPFRSAVGRRVARVLDASRAPSVRAGRAAAVALAACGVAGTLAAGLLGADRAARSTAAPVSSPPSPPPPSPAPARVAPATRPTGPDRDGVFRVRGRVLDPAGRPAAGARVTAASPSTWTDRFARPPLASTTAGPDGRFALAYTKAAAAPFSTGQGGSGADYWRTVPVIASADGAGLAWAQWDATDDAGDVVLRLVPDDVPIDGRVLDLEGRPVAGVSVTVAMVGPVDPELPYGGGGYGTPDAQPLRSIWMPLAAAGRPEPVVTDAAGRFRVSGLGRDRGAQLHLRGPTIGFAAIAAATRRMDPVTRTVDQPVGSSPRFVTYGASFDYAAAPGRSVRGVVRDAATGEPMAGVTVESLDFAGPFQGMSPLGVLRTSTDAQGRYRLDGLPKGKGNVVLAVPNDDQPYLMREAAVDDPPGLDPAAIDFDLHQGVWLTGRVTDKATGRPAPARIHWGTYPDNARAKALPELGGPGGRGHSHGYQGRHEARPDGSFRVVVVPGRWVVGAWSMEDRYRTGVGVEAVEALRDPARPVPLSGNPPYRHDSVVREVVVPEGDAGARADLELDPGETVRVAAEDPDGAPVTGGLAVRGTVSENYGGWYGKRVDGPAFDVTAMGPDDRRTLVLVDEARRLGRVWPLRLADVPDRRVTVRLQPMAELTGRLLTPDGDPAADVTLDVQLSDDGRSLPFATTGKDGRFRQWLPPGGRYGVLVFAGRYVGSTVAESVSADPGGRVDLGDVRLKRDGEADPADAAPATRPATQAATATQPAATRASETSPEAATAVTRPAAAAAPGNADAKGEAKVPPRPEPEGDEVRVRGVVLNLAGEPVAGAAVTVAANGWGDDPAVPVGPLDRATSGPDGRFALTFRKTQASPFSASDGRSGRDVWRGAVVAARADGFGVGWARWDAVDPAGDVTLRLVEDLPIEGRVVDLEGRPIAGATVTPSSVAAEVVLGLADNGKAKRDAVRLLRPYAATGLPAGVKTDAEGKFRLAGLGRERTVQLGVVADRGVTPPATVVTRRMETFTESVGANPDHKWERTVYGARPELALSPARPIVGTVRDGKTRRPIAGAAVTANPNWGWGEARAVTDGEGRYRLDGMKKADNTLLVSPPDGRPYLTREVKVGDEPGLRPTTADVDLSPGVWITGRVTDQVTGRPVPARIQYSPFRSNGFADAVPDYAALRNIGSAFLAQGQTVTKPDGTYRTVGIPGRGVVGVTNFDGGYRSGVGAERVKDVKRPGPFGGLDLFVEVPLERYSAVAEVDVPVDAAECRADFRLEPGGSVRVSVEDPDGRPLRGAQPIDFRPRSFSPKLETATGEAVGFGPDERRPVVVLHADRGLGRVSILGPDDVRRGSATIRLMPMAVFTGRAVSADGDPISGARLWADGVGPDAGKGGVLIMVGDALSDKDGRFVLRVPTGYRCVLGGSRDSGRAEYIPVREPFDPVPGTTDLGDVRLAPKRPGAGDDAPPRPTTRPATAPADGRAADGQEATAAGATTPHPVTDAGAAAVAAPSPMVPGAANPTVSAPAADEAGDEVRVRGVVLDPAGRPAAGAAVTVANNVYEDDPLLPRGPIARAAAGADGRFAVSFRKSAAAPAILLTEGRAATDAWRSVAVVATAGDLGMAWARWDQVDATGDVVLRLAADHVVEGRLVDLEGRPVAGVRVRPTELIDRVVLDVHAAAKARAATVVLRNPLEATGRPDGPLTDADGRFRVVGLGRERSLTFEAHGPTAVLTSHDWWVTRAMPVVRHPHDDQAGHAAYAVFGTPAVLTAAPARAVVGTVRDAATAAPLAGVRVEADPAYAAFGGGVAVTDGQGRYRLDGLPKRPGNRIAVFPPDGGTAYFAERRKLADEPGLGPMTVDVDLHAGVWLTGRVTDKATGRPVPSRVAYSPYRSNPTAAGHPFFRQLAKSGEPRLAFNDGRLHTRPDGTFRVPAVPGRGVLTALAADGRYVPGLGAETVTERGGNWGPDFPSTYDLLAPQWSSAAAEVDLPADRPAPPVDLRVELGGSVRVAVEDAAGRPVGEVDVMGMGSTGYGPFGPTIEVVGLRPDERRAVVVTHFGRKLGKVVVVGPDDVRRGSRTVRLEPLASVTGRLLDADGEPVERATVRASARLTGVNLGDVGLAADQSRPGGRFVLLVPTGCDFAVACEGPGEAGGNRPLAERLDLAAGATKDLGDVRLAAKSGD